MITDRRGHPPRVGSESSSLIAAPAITSDPRPLQRPGKAAGWSQSPLCGSFCLQWRRWQLLPSTPRTSGKMATVVKRHLRRKGASRSAPQHTGTAAGIIANLAAFYLALIDSLPPSISWSLVHSCVLHGCQVFRLLEKALAQALDCLGSLQPGDLVSGALPLNHALVEWRRYLPAYLLLCFALRLGLSCLAAA